MTTQPKPLRLADALDNPPGAPLFVEAAAELRRLQDENEKLEKALRYHILIYRVADEAWNPEADVDRIMKMVLGSGE